MIDSIKVNRTVSYRVFDHNSTKFVLQDLRSKSYFKNTVGVAKNLNHHGLEHFRYALGKENQTGPIYSALEVGCDTEKQACTPRL